MRGAVLAAAALALGANGCESTQEESARLEKTARHERLALQGVSVARENPQVQVLASEIVHGREGSAVVVRLRNRSSRPILAAPIAVTASDARGRTIYQNDAPGEDASLTKVTLLADRESVWIDDQVHTHAPPATATVKVGDGGAPSGSPPKLVARGLHMTGEGAEANAEGSLVNDSSKTQENLVVFVLARRGGRVVAAGRAVLPEVLPHASDSFQVYFVGNPAGSSLQASAPPTSF